MGYLVLGLVLFGVGAYHRGATTSARCTSGWTQWQNPWPSRPSPTQAATQLGEGWFGMGDGGVGGTGLGFDHSAGIIPELTSDMIFAAIGTEMGLVGCGGRRHGLHLAGGLGLPDRPDGPLGLLPPHGDRAHAHPRLPGLLHHGGGGAAACPSPASRCPFVAYGGSSLLANYILIALLLRISDEGAQKIQEDLASGVVQPGERPMVPV